MPARDFPLQAPSMVVSASARVMVQMASATSQSVTLSVQGTVRFGCAVALGTSTSSGPSLKTTQRRTQTRPVVILTTRGGMKTWDIAKQPVSNNILDKFQVGGIHFKNTFHI